MHDTFDALVSPVHAIKDLSDTGRFGGYLVEFSDPDHTDLHGDFFTADTDYWLDLGGEARVGKSAALYGHALDPVLKGRILDKHAVLKQDDAGVWMEGQLALRDEYEEILWSQGIVAGKMGFSSGTAAHLVDTEPVKNSKGQPVTHITRWPLGLDGSITPVPAMPSTKVEPLKAWSGRRWVKDAGLWRTDAGRTDAMKEMTLKEMSLQDQIALIRSDFQGQFQNRDGVDDGVYYYVMDVYPSYIIVEVNYQYFRISYTQGEERFEFAPRGEWEEVAEDTEWVARAEIKQLAKDLAGLNNHFLKDSDSSHHKSSHRDGAAKGARTTAPEARDMVSTLDSINQLFSRDHA